MTAGLFSQATLVVSGPATARLLGVTGRGELAILGIILILSSQLGSAGLPTAVAYTIAMRRMNARTVLSALAPIWISLCAAAGLAGAAATIVVGGGAASSVGLDASLVAIWVVSAMTLSLALACLQGEGRFRLLNWARPIATTAQAAGVLCLFLVAHRAAVSEVLSIVVASNVLACLIAVRLALAKTDPGLGVTARIQTRDLLRYGFASIVGASAPVDSLSIDQVIVSIMLSRAQLGLYVVGGAFNNLPSLLVSSLGTIALPRVAGEPEERERARLMKRTAVAAAIIAGGTTLFAELIVAWLLPVAFGASFSPAIPAARILIVAGFFLSLRRILVVFLQAVGRPGHTAVGEATALGVLAISAVLLIPPLGIVGAGCALAVAALASDVYLWLALRSRPAYDHSN
ncbi:MAG TPA: polysaccharide biosynthesis C-terminal domain-containing protein [Candidatus Acidoferrum sp.]|nr:polysaccharide biosynthesis C-terminal domain-containing protein [Candidatus Acidoferrum sp.]